MNPTPRVFCLLDGCRRTHRQDFAGMQWICQKHWSVIPQRYRQLYARAKRKYRRGEIDEARVNRIWGRCVKQAFRYAWCAG